MSRILNVATIHPEPAFTNAGVYGWESQPLFSEFLGIVGVSTYPDDPYADEYEVRRDELERAIDELIHHTGDYELVCEEAQDILAQMEMTEADMIRVLKNLVEKSDQSNEYVLIAWL